MKKIEAIVRPNALKAVLHSLKEIGYSGVTVTEAQGHGTQKGETEYYRSQSVEGLLPKLVISMIVENNMLEKTIEAIIKAAHKGEIGDGKIFISAVEQAIRIRTGEKGQAAI